MKSNFMESFEFYQNEIDILHYGKKGMKWGVRNTQPYVPIAERTQENQNDSISDAASSAEAVAEASPEKVSSTRKKVIKGLIIGGSIAAVVGGIVAGGIIAEKKNPGIIGDTLNKAKTTFSNLTRNKAGSTKAGENLRQKVAAASEQARRMGRDTANIGGLDYPILDRNNLSDDYPGRGRRRAL